MLIAELLNMAEIYQTYVISVALLNQWYEKHSAVVVARVIDKKGATELFNTATALREGEHSISLGKVLYEQVVSSRKRGHKKSHEQEQPSG